MVTTIKIHQDTKFRLDEIKGKTESYDDILKRVLAKIMRDNLKSELIEAYKSVGKKELELLKEWESASTEL